MPSIEEKLNILHTIGKDKKKQHKMHRDLGRDSSESTIAETKLNFKPIFIGALPEALTKAI